MAGRARPRSADLEIAQSRAARPVPRRRLQHPGVLDARFQRHGRPDREVLIMKTSRLIVPLLGLALAAAPAVAQQVGTATAVNPLSESTPPGGSTAPLVVGAHIVHKERIHTSPAGTMQLLFTDKSSMSIAPNTDIVIDEYVYNPGAKDGQM